MNSLPVRLNQHTRSTFVRNTVRENYITKFVIDAIMPYFPLTNRVIGGYVDESDQYWKADFHWEYLGSFLDKALCKDLNSDQLRCVKAIRAVLLQNKPNPEKGYKNAKVMGQPKDLSSREKIIRRWKITSQCKKDFKSVLNASGLLKGMPPKEQKEWLLSVAPVAKPGRSKHSTGYAVDIYGDNNKTVTISNALGASLVFPEGSHVHVEFAKGVAGKSLPFTAQTASFDPGLPEQHETMCLASPREVAELRHSTRNAQVTGDYGREIPHLEIVKDLMAESVGEKWWRG